MNSEPIATLPAQRQVRYPVRRGLSSRDKSETKSASPGPEAKTSTSTSFISIPTVKTNDLLRRTSLSTPSSASSTPKNTPKHPKVYTLGNIKDEHAAISPRIFSAYSHKFQASSKQRRMSLAEELLEEGGARGSISHSVSR